MQKLYELSIRYLKDTLALPRRVKAISDEG